MRARRALVVLGAGVVLAGTSAVVVQERRSSAPSTAPDAGANLLTAPVERRTLTDSVTVRGTAGHRSRSSLRFAVAGRVTQIGIAPSTDIAAGTTAVQVDGRPVVAVGGMFPFWRDLAKDATGADVTQLKALLRGDGQNPGTDDDVFSSATERALKAWQQSHGFPVDGTLRVGDTLVGVWPARAGKVAVAVGDFVSIGGEIAALTDPALSVAVELTPSDRLKVRTGQRANVELSATGRATTGTVADLANTPTAGQAASRTQQGSGDTSAGNGTSASSGTETERYAATITLEGKLDAVAGAQVRVQLILGEAPDALVVPVAAVVNDGSGRPTVRILENGRVRSARVTTGLGEGAYIQVLSGVDESQSVVLRTRR